jgi:hypothetical protein
LEARTSSLRIEVCKVKVHLQRNPARRIGLGVVSASMLALSVGGSAFAEPLAQPAPSCAVPPQGIVITIDVPNPGAVIPPGGNVVVSGTAYDTSSPAGPAIDRVSVFLGDRDAGGIFWGDATLQQATPQLGGQLTAAGWSRRSPTIPLGSGSREIFAYAHSLFSGKEASTSIPVFLGAAPTAVRGQVPTPVPGPLPPCTPTPTPAPTATSTPVPPPATATSAPTVAATLPPTVAVPPPAPAPPPPAAPAAPPAAPAPAAAPPAVAPAAAQTTAPSGGGIPNEVGLLIVGIGASVLSGGFVLRRRDRRGGQRQD